MTSLFIDPTALRTHAAPAHKKAEQAGAQFEAIMLKELVKHAVPKSVDGADGMSAGMSTWTDMLAEQLAGAMASSGQLGIGTLIAERISGNGANSADHAPHKTSEQITSGFGLRKHPVTGERSFHHGVDVAAANGTPLRAPMDGVVEKVSNVGHGGLSVTLRHADQRTSTYRHLENAQVHVGDRVQAGEMFAQSGESGRVTGPHLHMEMTHNGRKVDPTAYVDRVITTENAQEARQ